MPRGERPRTFVKLFGDDREELGGVRRRIGVDIADVAPVYAFEPPKQLTLVALMVALSAEAGCAMVMVDVTVQLAASVTVTVYVPADRLKMSCVVAPFDHR